MLGDAGGRLRHLPGPDHQPGDEGDVPYPSIENFLVPIYATGASSNDGDYSNPDFDAKLQEAAEATDPDEAISLYQEAEAMLAEDLPAIPLWNYSVIAGHSTNIATLKITPFSTIDVLSLELAS